MKLERDMSCSEIVELVTEYVEGMLSADDQARFERHLSICPGCRTYLEQFRETIAITGELREEDVPPPARAELLAQFRDWKSAP